MLGSRTIGIKKRSNKYKITYFGNKILTLFFSFINFYSLSDIASCYWLIETKVLKNLNIQEKGFAIEVEVLSKFLQRENKIIEVPINYDGDFIVKEKKLNLKMVLIYLLKS